MRARAPLLLLPGLLCDARFWRAQMDGLAAICEPRVVSYGLSDSIEAMAACVLADAPQRFAVAGHSMGGRVALEVYRRAPERVIGLALLCTDYRAAASPEAKQAEAAERDEWLEIARTRGMHGFARKWLPEIVAPERLHDTALVGDIVEMFARQPIEVLEAQTRAGLTRPDYAELLPHIRCQTLICAGAMDTFRPLSSHREMAAKIPLSTLVVIKGCGHMAAMEQPDILTAAMRDWLLS
jgi:pimeloyl-ACP methyl ester carboxylesterase